MKRRILILDDHEMVREGLAVLVNSDPRFCVVGHVGSTAEAREFLERQPVDLALVDFSLQDGTGIAFLHDLADIQPDCIGVLLTMHKDAIIHREAIAAGAAGVIVKDDASDVLLTELLQFLGFAEARVETPILSRREEQVLAGLTDGLTSKEIAQQLGIRQKTVETYRERLHAKFGSSGTGQLVHFATRYSVRQPGAGDRASVRLNAEGVR